MLRATLLSYKTGVMRLVLVVALAAAQCFAAEAVPVEYQGKLDGEMKKLNERYDDIRKELDEEFVAISRDRENLGKLKEERQKDQAHWAAKERESTAGRAAADRATVERDASNQPGVVRAYETAKDAVADTYHDAVHYLTD